MARPRKHDGVVYRRNDSSVWWMRYRDRDGTRRLESTNSTDWDEAQRQLRERLAARDNNSLEILRKGKQLTFNDWGNFFLANYSKPPLRAVKTHEANENALKSLRQVLETENLSILMLPTSRFTLGVGFSRNGAFVDGVERLSLEL